MSRQPHTQSSEDPCKSRHLTTLTSCGQPKYTAIGYPLYGCLNSLLGPVCDYPRIGSVPRPRFLETLRLALHLNEALPAHDYRSPHYLLRYPVGRVHTFLWTLSSSNHNYRFSGLLLSGLTDYDSHINLPATEHQTISRIYFAF
ncbi:hypothetical protein OE88DRAFT_1268780 [Heliocybe sulcata]|uniref:Uncharacterized protein n=1 Tax=Heliocybe sulcata TaxID=5364 RepID=A0A5C3NB42_9AGAM|nr:hypothetical protein OE88DRAFT_1268780 [Heliocybe sulcata]